jgi:hypothetical protein
VLLQAGFLEGPQRAVARHTGVVCYWEIALPVGYCSVDQQDVACRNSRRSTSQSRGCIQSCRNSSSSAQVGWESHKHAQMLMFIVPG